ncbi:copper chaperone PCu(A)C [Rhodoplanes sp. SY1]|uniref:copper chaperone PCu(A)C n=1 Tax=Rhodoplanes sp. SY1 TaxID=3166646 RepID=UPI0038B44771
MRSLVTILAALVCLAWPATAQTWRAGTIEIASAWARATPPGASVTAGYMRITNHGFDPDRLVSIRSAVAGSVEVQELSLDDNVMRLRTLARGLPIRPGETIDLRPGYPWQAVFASLTAQLRPGDRLPATLVFEKAGAVEVELVVQPIGTGIRRASAGGG